MIKSHKSKDIILMAFILITKVDNNLNQIVSYKHEQ